MCDVIGCTAAIDEWFWGLGRRYCSAHAPLHCHTVYPDGTKCQSEMLRKLYEDRRQRVRVYLCMVCHKETRLPL